MQATTGPDPLPSDPGGLFASKWMNAKVNFLHTQIVTVSNDYPMHILHDWTISCSAVCLLSVVAQSPSIHHLSMWWLVSKSTSGLGLARYARMLFVYSAACFADVRWEVAQRNAVARSIVLSSNLCRLSSDGICDQSFTGDTGMSNSMHERHWSALSLPAPALSSSGGGPLCHQGRVVAARPSTAEGCRFWDHDYVDVCKYYSINPQSRLTINASTIVALVIWPVVSPLNVVSWTSAGTKVGYFLLRPSCSSYLLFFLHP